MSAAAIIAEVQSVLPDGMKPCGKRWYHSKAEAESEMVHMHASRGPDWRLNAYYCFDCDGFHVGHTMSKRKAKIRARLLLATAVKP